MNVYEVSWIMLNDTKDNGILVINVQTFVIAKNAEDAVNRVKNEYHKEAWKVTLHESDVLMEEES